MLDDTASAGPQTAEGEWVTFEGGELQGMRPKVQCLVCRSRRGPVKEERGGPGSAPLCFQCYRAGLERNRALMAAANLHTASARRFQYALPFEPVNRPRLVQLRLERATARAAFRAGAGRFIDRRRRAQIDARHVLQRIAATMHVRKPGAPRPANLQPAALHALELQLPQAWIPFVLCG